MKFGGRDMRLTDVHGVVQAKILAWRSEGLFETKSLPESGRLFVLTFPLTLQRENLIAITIRVGHRTVVGQWECFARLCCTPDSLCDYLSIRTVHVLPVHLAAGNRQLF